MIRSILASLTVSLATFAPARAQHHSDDVGTVRFQVSCASAVVADFDRAVAMLHHMMYVQAREAFRDIARRDPACANPSNELGAQLLKRSDRIDEIARVVSTTQTEGPVDLEFVDSDARILDRVHRVVRVPGVDECDLTRAREAWSRAARVVEWA